MTVLSTPAGSDIRVDGRFVGDTPSTLEVAAGNRTIEVVKSGYQTWKRAVTLAAGSSVTLDATLAAAQ